LRDPKNVNKKDHLTAQRRQIKQIEGIYVTTTETN